MSLNIKKLSALEFRRTLAGSRYNEQSRQILWAVLGEGRTQNETAVQFGVSRQRVNRLLNFFKEAYAEKVQGGSALVGVTFDMPSELAGAVSDFLTQYAACRNGPAKALAVSAVIKILIEAQQGLARS